MATMAVIGIDLGNESCYVAVAKAGGIETIANDYSLRGTPSYVAFSGKNRILGVAAKNQQVTNLKNTVYNLKRLIGRKFRDPHVQRELQFTPFNLTEIANGNIGIKVSYLNEEHIFSPEQCLAMLLTKLKDISSQALQTPINDCVISVPSYFTNNERKAVLDAAAIAGINVLRLFNETTATALTYGIYKQDLPPSEEKPRNVVFVDCGHSALQVSTYAFHRGTLKRLATTADPYLGGRDFDHILADHFAKEFQTKYKVDAKSNARAYLRLLAEVEKLKKQMSANSTTLPLGIECFMDDKDVRSEIKRTDMEALCDHLLQRVEHTMKLCLEQSQLPLEDIYSVEIVGGSSRIPAIKQLIEKIFKKVPSTTLNQDESVSRGCALQCAMLSPAVRVRDFSVTDGQSYPISIAWEASPDGESSGGEMEVFPINHPAPYTKVITFYRKEPFTIRAFYSGEIPYPDKNLGTWTIKDIRPNVEGKPQKVKVYVKINLHGIMTVSSASLFESKEAPENEGPIEGQQQQQSPQENNDQQKNEADVPMADNAANVSPTPEVGSGISWTRKISGWFSGEGDVKKKKKQVVEIDLPIESLTYGFSQVELNQYTEQEFKMIAADRQEKERADARNTLEEYVYELRGKLLSEEELALYVIDSDREALIRQLDAMENWLYEDGEDCNRKVYQDKLSELKAKGEPIQTRKIEADLRPIVIEDFARCLQLCMKVLEQIKSSDPKFAHLTEEDVKKIDQAFRHAYQFLEDVRAKTSSAPKHIPPPVTVAQIRQEKADFESTVNPVVNKPPPKAPSPPKENNSSDAQQQNTSQHKGDQNQQNQNNQQAKNQQDQSQQNNSLENMDWSNN